MARLSLEKRCPGCLICFPRMALLYRPEFSWEWWMKISADRDVALAMTLAMVVTLWRHDVSDARDSTDLGTSYPLPRRRPPVCNSSGAPRHWPWANAPSAPAGWLINAEGQRSVTVSHARLLLLVDRVQPLDKKTWLTQISVFVPTLSLSVISALIIIASVQSNFAKGRVAAGLLRLHSP